MEMMAYLIAGLILGAGTVAVLHLLAARKAAEDRAAMIAQNAVNIAGMESARAQTAALQAQLAARDRTIEEQQRTLAAQQAQFSALEAKSAAEAQAGAEKLALLQNAE